LIVDLDRQEPVPNQLPRITHEQRPQFGGAKLLLLIGLAVLAFGLSAAAALVVSGRWRPSPAALPSLETRKEQDQVARGRLAFQVYCAACHGQEGHGDGPSAAELKPPPRDLAAGDWKFGTSPAAVRRVIAEGVPGTAMPASPALSAAELDALAAYVLSLLPNEKDLPRSTRSLMTKLGMTPAAPRHGTPSLALCDIEGRRTTLASLRGKMVLVVFWETSCLPCLQKLPQLEQLAASFRDQDLIVLPVCVNEGDITPLRRVAEKHVKSLPLYVDSDGSARFRFGVDTVPQACLIDRSGHIVGSGTGPSDWTSADVKELLRAYLKMDL
jgi:mono/diheme cytochrome c family protein/peroxiredoxin